METAPSASKLRADGEGDSPDSWDVISTQIARIDDGEELSADEAREWVYLLTTEVVDIAAANSELQTKDFADVFDILAETIREETDSNTEQSD